MRRKRERARKKVKKNRQIDQINTITQLAHCFDRDVVYIVEKRNFVPIRHDRYLFDVSVFVFSFFHFIFCFLFRCQCIFSTSQWYTGRIRRVCWANRREKRKKEHKLNEKNKKHCFVVTGTYN